jgi:hypothetical protein
MTGFDPSRAHLNKKDKFQRFRVKESESLEKSVKTNRITSDDQILILERSGERLVFSGFKWLIIMWRKES